MFGCAKDIHRDLQNAECWDSEARAPTYEMPLHIWVIQGHQKMNISRFRELSWLWLPLLYICNYLAYTIINSDINFCTRYSLSSCNKTGEDVNDDDDDDGDDDDDDCRLV